MDIIQTTALITINDTVWIQLLSFLAFLFVINRVMFRPLLRTMAERTDHIEAMRRDIRDAAAEMEALLAQAAAEENLAREASRRQRNQLLIEGRAEAGRILENTKIEIGRLRKETEAALSRDLAEARRKIATESPALATVIMEAILERKLK